MSDVFCLLYGEIERTPFTFLGLEPDSSSILLHKLLAQDQAQACTFFT